MSREALGGPVYRLFPADVRAVRWTGDNIQEVISLAGTSIERVNEPHTPRCSLTVTVPGGRLDLKPGYYLVLARGRPGEPEELAVYAPDRFRACFEAVNDAARAQDAHPRFTARTQEGADDEK